MPSTISLDKSYERFHARLMAGDDPIVTSEIAEALLPQLVSSLSLRFANLSDEQLIDGAVEDALLNYFADPSRFNPAKGTLLAWLWQCARNNLLNALKKQTTYLRKEKSVELEVAETVYQAEAEIEAALINRSVNEQTMQRLRAILPDQTDLRIVILMMEGNRETAVFAEVMSISHLPIEEQQKLVKQHKDRLKKAVQRHYRRGRQKQ